MRLFFAIELSEPFREHLSRVQQALRGVAKAGWTRPENLHLTLKFLGEVPDGEVAGVCRAVEAVEPAGPIELTATQLLCFPSGGSIRIVGAGIDAPAGLGQLVERIELACEPLGFPRERRPYRPHITLARARFPLPASLRRQLADASAALWPGPAMPVGRFVLMESKLLPQGPVYTPAATYYIKLPK